jgi:cytidylate kinase
VRVVAPLAHRAATVASRAGIDPSAATAETERRDAHRARYLKHHFGCDNNDPTLYSVQFNTARLSTDAIVAAIATLVA